MSMHRLLSLLALAGVLTIPALGSAQSVSFRVTAPVAPPAPRVVHHAPAPAPGYVWVNGSWAWQGAQWVWTDGYWVQDRPGYVVVPDRWVHDGRRWVRHRGGWAARGSRRVVYGFEPSRRYVARRAPVYAPARSPHRAARRHHRQTQRRIARQQARQQRAHQRAMDRHHRAVERQQRAVERRARGIRRDTRRGARVRVRPAPTVRARAPRRAPGRVTVRRR